MDIKKQCDNCNWYPHCQIEKRQHCTYFENQKLNKKIISDEIFMDLTNSTYNRFMNSFDSIPYDCNYEQLICKDVLDTSDIEDIDNYLDIL